MLGLIAAVLGSGWSWLGFGLPLGLNSVEGSEAALLVGASAARGGWRKALVAALAALVSLVPIVVGLYFLFQYEPGEYVDYGIAIVIFGLGLNEIREGLESRPRGDSASRHGLDGPVGIDPSRADTIRAFQEERGLEPDGVLGPLTRGVIASVAAERDERLRPNRVGVDVSDEASIRAYQRSRGLVEDGLVGAETQGALAADAAAPLLSADAAEVRRFQAEHGLTETGVLDEVTQAALRALERERGDDDSAFAVDPTDAEAVRRFQRSRGLSPSGVVDRATQGAMRAERARLDRLGRHPGEAELAGVDPTDPDSLERFQREHGLDPNGEIDDETRAELQRAEEWIAGMDPTDPLSVERFQLEHGLEPTGVIGAETQGVLEAVRTELHARHGRDGDDDGEGHLLPVDVADPESVRAFQREHGLSADGVVGPQTQAALRAVTHERAESAVAEEANAGGIAGTLGSYADVWPAYVGGVLEASEAVLYTFGVSSGSASWVAASVGGGVGFLLPWAGLPVLRRWVESRPEWLVELSIGLVLMAAASAFGTLRATGVFGG